MTQYGVGRPWAGTPWEALNRLERDLGTLFGRQDGVQSRPGNWRGVFPPVNLYETPDAFILTAELAGVDPEDIHVSIEESTVTIQGERKIDYENQEGASLHRRERPSGSFRRAFALRGQVDSDKVEAVQKNGVLMLRIPKSEEAKPRQIAVQTS